MAPLRHDQIALRHVSDWQGDEGAARVLPMRGAVRIRHDEFSFTIPALRRFVFGV
jgi:hypothetical protein